MEASSLRWRAWRNPENRRSFFPLIADHRAHRRIQIAHLQTEESSNRPAAFEDLEKRVFHVIRRNGESHPLKAGALLVLGENGHIDADYFATQVHQGSARISRIDRRIRLEEIALVIGQRPLFGRNDSLRHGFAKAEWIANRQYDLPHLGLRRIAQFQGNKRLIRINFQHCNIQQRILADEACRIRFPTMKRHPNLLLSGDHMMIGHDVPFLRHDHTRPLSLGWIIANTHLPPDVEQLLAADSRGIDTNNRRHHYLGDSCVLVVESGQQLHVSKIQRNLIGKRECLWLKLRRLFGKIGKQAPQTAFCTPPPRHRDGGKRDHKYGDKHQRTSNSRDHGRVMDGKSQASLSPKNRRIPSPENAPQLPR